MMHRVTGTISYVQATPPLPSSCFPPPASPFCILYDPKQRICYALALKASHRAHPTRRPLTHSRAFASPRLARLFCVAPSDRRPRLICASLPLACRILFARERNVRILRPEEQGGGGGEEKQIVRCPPCYAASPPFKVHFSTT